MERNHEDVLKCSRNNYDKHSKINHGCTIKVRNMLFFNCLKISGIQNLGSNEINKVSYSCFRPGECGESSKFPGTGTCSANIQLATGLQGC